MPKGAAHPIRCGWVVYEEAVGCDGGSVNWGGGRCREGGKKLIVWPVENWVEEENSRASDCCSSGLRVGVDSCTG